jgi:hypothetical protein
MTASRCADLRLNSVIAPSIALNRSAGSGSTAPGRTVSAGGLNGLDGLLDGLFVSPSA